MPEMSKERLAELRAEYQRPAGRGNGWVVTGTAHVLECLDEIDRLNDLANRREAIADDAERAKVAANLIAQLSAELATKEAESTRYEGALEDIAYHLPVGIAQERLFIAISIATRALNPEPAS